MSHARPTAKPQPLMLVPGQKVRIINKRGEREPEGIVIMYDKERMLVLVEAFTDQGTSTWWIPDYMAVPIGGAPEAEDVTSG